MEKLPLSAPPVAKVKVWVSPALGSVALSVPMMAPAVLFSAILEDDKAMSVGAAFAKPVSAMSNGFSAPGELLAIWIAALRTPLTVGLKVTVKVTLPAPTGMLVPLSPLTMNSLVAPVIARPVRSAVPGFVMVKVSGTLPPKATAPKFTVPAPSIRAAACATAM